MPDSVPPFSVLPKSLPQAPAAPSVAQTLGDSGSGPNSDSVYKPLSILAIVGFCLALPYALFITIGALVALYVGSPYLLGILTAVVPIVAVLLCGIALVRINRSEGTLGGARLAIWGLRLSLLFGLGYWAYFTATYFAIRQQANEFSQKWLQKVADGQINSAFILVIDPKNKPPKENPANPQDPALQAEIEKRFNGGAMGDQRGMYSKFPEHDINRFLTLMSKPVTIEFLGCSDWEYKDGYTLGLRYRLVGKEGSVNVKVTVQGVDGDDESASGRRWFVRLERTNVDGKPQFNREGDRKMAICVTSKMFLQDWLKNLSLGFYDRAYLDMLEPKDFETKSSTLIQSYLPLITTTPTYASVPAGALGCYMSNYLIYSNWERQEMPAFPDLTKGNLVRLSPDGFSAPEEIRQMVVQEIKDRFSHPDQDLLRILKGEQSTLPLVTEEGEKLIISLDCAIQLVTKQILVDGAFIVECDKDIGENDKPLHFRMKSYDIRRARKVDSFSNLRKIPL